MCERKIRLVACDMDGTLLNDAKEVPGGFIPWVKSHPRVKVVIASGRQYETLRRDFEEIQDMLYFIAENGALTFHRGNLLHIEEADRGLIFDAIALVKEIDNVTPIICCAKSAYMTPSSPRALYNAQMYYKKLEITDDLVAATAKDRPVKIACYIQLLEACAESYAMENSHPEVKAIARHTAPSNEDNGVMETLYILEDRGRF